VAVLHAAEPVRRSIADCIALAKAREEETHKAPVLDLDFAEDMEEVLSQRWTWNPPAWESSSTPVSLSLPNVEAIPFEKSSNSSPYRGWLGTDGEPVPCSLHHRHLRQPPPPGKNLLGIVVRKTYVLFHPQTIRCCYTLAKFLNKKLHLDKFAGEN